MNHRLVRFPLKVVFCGLLLTQNLIANNTPVILSNVLSDSLIDQNFLVNNAPSILSNGGADNATISIAENRYGVLTTVRFSALRSRGVDILSASGNDDRIASYQPFGISFWGRQGEANLPRPSPN